MRRKWYAVWVRKSNGEIVWEEPSRTQREARRIGQEAIRRGLSSLAVVVSEVSTILGEDIQVPRDAARQQTGDMLAMLARIKAEL